MAARRRIEKKHNPVEAAEAEASAALSAGYNRVVKNAEKEGGFKTDATSRFLGYLDRIQAEAELVLRKAGYTDPSAMIEDPLTRQFGWRVPKSRFHCGPGGQSAIELSDLPSALNDPKKSERYAFEMMGWVREMRKLMTRTQPEGREALAHAYWLGCNVSTAEIGVRLPEVGAVLRAWWNTEIATKRTGFKGELRHAVERICKNLKKPTLEALLEAFEEDNMLDLYEARNDPINIAIQAVNSDEKTVHYRTRDGKEKTVRFDRLERLIREIK